jgi:flagellar basal-body rod protein FlgB
MTNSASSSNMNFSGTDSYLRAAMSGMAARQRTIANNVANVDTTGFKATQVNFEDMLNTAVNRCSANSMDQNSLNAAASRSTLNNSTTSRADGNNVDIDQQMEQLGETNISYSALTQVMATRIGILRSVIKGS